MKVSKGILEFRCWSWPLVLALALALTKAEIIERFRSPAVTQADGLVKVYADCPEDMRREFQSPIARFAADTVQTLYQGLAKKPVRFEKPGIVITVGDVRTNLAAVTAHVTTNDSRVVTRIRVWSPGFADLVRFRTEIVKGFYRSVESRELDDAAAVTAYRHADPSLRVYDERMKFENWLAGRGTTNDEEGLRLYRRVFEPGKANRRDILVFASRLYLYPPQQDVRFLGKYDCLSFREAVRFAKIDVSTRLQAYLKANELPVAGGGRGEELAAAAEAYREFLLAFAKGDRSEKVLLDLLDDADAKLNVAFERAQ